MEWSPHDGFNSAVKEICKELLSLQGENKEVAANSFSWQALVSTGRIEGKTASSDTPSSMMGFPVVIDESIPAWTFVVRRADG